MLKTASFFAGVGGVDLAFEQAGFKTVYANEINPFSCKAFEENFDIKVDKRSILDVLPSDIPDCDVFLGGFPCQAFSVAGLRQGFSDEKGRGTLFFELHRLIKAKMPQVVFLENVKNLKSHDKGNTFKVIYEALSELGYYVSYKVLNSAHYGIPQGRERIYIVCFLDKNKHEKFCFPKPVNVEPVKVNGSNPNSDLSGLSNYIDFNSKVDERYYYAKSSSLFQKLKESVVKENTVYQWRRTYIRENKKGICPTLTANMGTGGHNVPIIKAKHGIRKLTPRECFNLQGFPTTFILPNGISNSKLYEQAGNSVTVPVVKLIADKIFELF